MCHGKRLAGTSEMKKTWLYEEDMAKTMEKHHILNRTAFIRQPARVLLVDYSPPFDPDTCEYLQESLVDFFSLVTHLSGPCRTPFFGLFGLTSYAESLFSLQHVRGNFSRLHSAIEQLKLFGKGKNTNQFGPEVILQGLKEADAQFRRQSQSLRQMSTSSCQLEIVLMTCRSAVTVNKHIEKFAKTLDLESLKKIQVVAVQGTDDLNMVEDDSRSDGSSPGTDEDGLLGCGLVDVVFIEKNLLSFRNFFKTWLLDCSTDQEHMRIAIPSAFTPDSDSDQSQEKANTSLILKCDLYERLLNPLHLPYQSHLTVCSESASLTSKGVAVTKPNVLTYPVYNLTTVKLIKTDAICESVLYGMPYIVRPTLCWKLDWEDLEGNQHHFYALCSILKQRNVALLAKAKGESIASSGRQLPSPQGHFLLLPSENNSLLLKSIAVSELMLPNDIQTHAEEPSESALSVVESCLDQVELATSFNPLLIYSGLCHCLVSQSLKCTSVARPIKRRLQVSQKTQALNLSENSDSVNHQQTKKIGARSQIRRVVFTVPAAKNTAKPPQTEFRSAGLLLSTPKRFRTTSAANLYTSNPPTFPENL